MKNRCKTTMEQGRWFAPRRVAIAGVTTIILLGLAGGCATRDASSVRMARAKLDAVRQGGLVDSDSLDFREAERHLADAEELLADRGNQELIDHEAEMAGLYSSVAVARTEAIAAQQEARAYLALARVDTASTRVAVEMAIRNARSVDARQTERGLVLTLGGVLFAFDSADLTPEAQLSVARVAGFLIALSDRDAVVEGHADNLGDDEYNVGLSSRRAESILGALVGSGVAEDRLAAEGYGSHFPVANNDSDEGRERNRRVEIVILRPGLTAEQAHR